MESSCWLCELEYLFVSSLGRTLQGVSPGSIWLSKGKTHAIIDGVISLLSLRYLSYLSLLELMSYTILFIFWREIIHLFQFLVRHLSLTFSLVFDYFQRYSFPLKTPFY